MADPEDQDLLSSVSTMDAHGGAGGLLRSGGGER